FCVRRLAGNQTPAAEAGLRSSHGHASRSATSAPGSSTPPRNAPLTVKDPIFTVESVTISWSHRKYQGALAGFGVTSGLAGFSRGERTKTERIETIAIVPSTAIAARRTRSGTELTVSSGVSSDVARIVGAVPRATPSSV